MGNLLAILLTPFRWAWWLLTALAWLFGFIERAVYRWLVGDKKGVHGDAKFANLKELKKAGHTKPLGMLVGKLGKQKIWAAETSSILVFAPKRSGKSLTTIAMLKDRAEHQETLIVVDPEGGLQTGAQATLLAHGYDVRCINIQNPTATDTHYNPISIINLNFAYDVQRDASNLATLMFAPDSNLTQPFFQNMSMLLLNAAIIYVARSYPQPTIKEVVEILTANLERREAFIAAALSSPDMIVRQAATSFKGAHDKGKGDVISTLTTRLSVWGSPVACEILRDDPKGAWTWRDVFMADKPSAIFIRAGLGSAEGEMARVIMGMAVNELRRMHNYGQASRRWTRIVVDESLTIGNCTAIYDANNELAKAKMSTWMAWLSYEDFKKTYKDSAKGILNNSEIMVFGGGKDIDAYELVSKLIGDITIESGSVNEGEYGETKGRNEQARRLVKIEEFRLMTFKQLIVTLGVHNAKLEKIVD